MHGGKERRVPIRPAFLTNSVDAAIGHAVRGGGIASVLSYQVVEHVRARRLELLLSRFEPPPLPIQLVYAGARLHSPLPAPSSISPRRRPGRFSISDRLYPTSSAMPTCRSSSPKLCVTAVST